MSSDLKDSEKVKIKFRITGDTLYIEWFSQLNPQKKIGPVWVELGQIEADWVYQKSFNSDG